MKIFKKIVYANSEYRISRYKLFGITIIKKVKENKQQNQSTKKIFFLRLPVLQVIKNDVGIKVKLFGIQVFKNKKNNNIVKYYVLGIKIFSKKLFISHISIDDILEFKQFEKPLVSIIIPVYNQYNYTIQCLQSILKSKDTTPFEIIIADDCSTDKTRTITKKVKNISVITSNKNNVNVVNVYLEVHFGAAACACHWQKPPARGQNRAKTKKDPSACPAVTG